MMERFLWFELRDFGRVCYVLGSVLIVGGREYLIKSNVFGDFR